jgi:aspartate 1-decarboxylase
MEINVFKSKIHRATVTHADLDYEGSVTIDADLLDQANIVAYESVHVWNVTRGSRIVTYALTGPRGSGAVCINGAAAHLNQPGDIVILATFANMSRSEALKHRPVVVRVDGNNKPLGSDAPEVAADVLHSVAPWA